VTANDLLMGNSLRSVIIAGSIVVVVMALIWAIRAAARHRLRNALQTESEVDDFFLGGANRTRLWLLFLPVLFLGTRTLKTPAELHNLLLAGAKITMIAQVAHWTSGVVEFWIRRWRRRRMESDPGSVTTLNAFRVAAIVGIWLVAGLVAVDNLGIEIGPLIAGLGIGGVAVALATQNILGDLFASLSIVIDKPFVIGDTIVVGDVAGTVEHIGLKSTLIRSISGEQLVVGNADLLKSRIRNFKRMTERRVVFRIGVVYQTPPEKLEKIPQLIRAAVENRQQARFDRSHFVAFGDSWYEFETAYWVTMPEYDAYADVHQEICFDVIRAFAAEGVEFAYPTRTVIMSGA
jgi:small-conductance mechanosensitive channel